MCHLYVTDLFVLGWGVGIRPSIRRRPSADCRRQDSKRLNTTSACTFRRSLGRLGARLHASGRLALCRCVRAGAFPRRFSSRSLLSAAVPVFHTSQTRYGRLHRRRRRRCRCTEERGQGLLRQRPDIRVQVVRRGSVRQGQRLNIHTLGPQNSCWRFPRSNEPRLQQHPPFTHPPLHVHVLRGPHLPSLAMRQQYRTCLKRKTVHLQHIPQGILMHPL